MSINTVDIGAINACYNIIKTIRDNEIFTNIYPDDIQEFGKKSIKVDRKGVLQKNRK